MRHAAVLRDHQVSTLRETRKLLSDDSRLNALVEDQLTGASPGLLRELLAMFIRALMGAEADVLCGAGDGQRSDERINSRNGYRHRDFDPASGPSTS